MSYNQTQAINQDAVNYAVDNLNEIIEQSVKLKPSRQLALLIIKLAHIVASWGIIQE
jgi:hypothetical protein